MKHFFLILFAFGTSLLLNAQSGSAKQVKWNFGAKKISTDTYEIKMTASVSGDFHIYAQNAGVEGPVPTTFSFSSNPLLSLNGKTKEVGKLVRKNEEVWGGDVNYYEKSVEFVQVVKLKGKAKTNVSGKVEFMVCNESVCLPPSEVEFKIPVGG
jgi:thiol:disulfide interchange protein DsbD